MYPLSVSPAAPNGHCVLPRDAARPASPCAEEATPPRVIQLMPSAIMHPLLLSPGRGPTPGDFRHSRGTPQENGREGKGQQQSAVHYAPHGLNLAAHQLPLQDERHYRNQIIMPVSPPEEQATPMGRIAGQTPPTYLFPPLIFPIELSLHSIMGNVVCTCGM